ncbi:MAG: Do family serine endopeptidase [Caulobacterales bacterium]|nr:Do family serine endopeptidase [Caulobacterales bacterium]
MTRSTRVARNMMLALSGGAAAAAVAFAALPARPVGADEPITVERLANGAPMSFADLIEQVSPAVVSVMVVTESPSVRFNGDDFEFEGLPEDFEDLFREFRRRFEDSGPREGRSLGSGFFISADGLLVTNNHVIENSREIMIELKNGDEYPAELLGSDPASDLAVLKVEGDNPFPYVQFSEEMDIRVGDWVVAVGNPFGLESTATAGIVSAIGRETGARYNAFIQIDAPINRGNSGGPTFDLKGRVVGVNSQIFSPSGGSVGIGFAIPADVAAKYTQQLIDGGRVVRGWLGVNIQSVSEDIAASLGLEEAQGAIVSSVVPGSPADEAGLRSQDIVLTVGRDRVEDAIDLTRRVGDLAAGETVRFRVLRDGREETIRVKIGERPSDDELSGERPSSGGSDRGGMFGMSLSRLTENDRRRLGLEDGAAGVLVDDLGFDSVAFEKGVREGEAVLEVGGEPIDSAQAFRRAVSRARDDGREAVLLLVRNERGARFVALPLTEDEE